jgi:hypothetical protein
MNLLIAMMADTYSTIALQVRFIDHHQHFCDFQQKNCRISHLLLATSVENSGNDEHSTISFATSLMDIQ